MIVHTKKFTAAVLAVLALTLMTGCGAQAETTLGVQTVKAQKKSIETAIPVAGVLLPTGTVTLSSKTLGQVVNVSATVGDTVKQGQTLVTLDTTQLNAQLTQAEAALKQANAAVRAAKSTASAASSAVTSAQGQANTAKINYDAAKSAYDAMKAAYDGGSATEADLQKAFVAMQVAQSQYDTANNGAVNQAKYSSSSASRNVNTLEAAVEVAQANVDLVNVQIANATITSPVDGVVVSRNYNPGELATAGAQLLTIMQAGPLKLKGTISQSALPWIAEGEAVDVSVDIYTGKTFAGKVSMIAPMAVATGEYFPIEISVEQAEGLKPGLSARTNIPISSQDTLSVPSAAVVQEDGQSVVYVFADGKVKRTQVTAGLSDGNFTEILSGLSEGQEVVCANTNLLKDNMPVRKL